MTEPSFRFQYYSGKEKSRFLPNTIKAAFHSSGTDYVDNGRVKMFYPAMPDGSWRFNTPRELLTPCYFAWDKETPYYPLLDFLNQHQFKPQWFEVYLHPEGDTWMIKAEIELSLKVSKMMIHHFLDQGVRMTDFAGAPWYLTWMQQNGNRV